MIRLAIIVEGLTEHRFVTDLLMEHFSEKMEICPTNLKGGKISKDRIMGRVTDMIHNFDYVTTQIDFYEFKHSGLRKSIDELETDLKESVKVNLRDRFIPYVQKYEFEALLFSDREQILSYFNDKTESKTKLKESVHPEDINHDEPPSKLLIKNYPGYNKITDGIEIAKKIGLGKMREQCPRFNQWLAQLEALVAN